MTRPVREWDVGKKEELEREMERSRERERDRERKRHSNDRDRERDQQRDRRRSTSASPGNYLAHIIKAQFYNCIPNLFSARKFKKKENDPPLRLLDDLFRKTKTTPCIYWLPLTPEQVINY